MMAIKGKKKLLAQALMVSGVSDLLCRFQSGKLMVFNFHRIRNDDPKTIYEFDEEVFGPTASEFKAQMLWLKKNTNIVSEAQLLAALNHGAPLPPRSTMVTFDDGYIDNYTLALPVLKELKIPAIYYIPTESIDERKLGWWDQIAYVVKRTQKQKIRLFGEDIAIQPSRDCARAKIILRMKLKDASENVNLLNELSEACEVALPDFEACSRELMTWDQVKETLSSGITIGSHTHTQRVLSTLSIEDQKKELLDSKTRLEKELSVPMRTLAYPVGGYEHFNLETQEIARECGYEAAFSFTHEINELNQMSRYNIKRLVPPEEIPLYVGTLALPNLYVKRRSSASSIAQKGP